MTARQLRSSKAGSMLERHSERHSDTFYSKRTVPALSSAAAAKYLSAAKCPGRGVLVSVSASARECPGRGVPVSVSAGECRGKW